MSYKSKMDKWEATALERTLKIHNSHPFIKQEDKTQIITPKHKKKDIYRTRQTHVQETAVIASMIATRLGFKYKKQLFNICISHDLGHSPYGHEGGKILDVKMRKAGLREGFSDNNANFDVIFNNQMEYSDYELASIVKKPQNLYGYQKKYLQEMIDRANAFEAAQWGTNKVQTMGSLIMDFADPLSYAFSDFVDGYALGYTKFTACEFVKSLKKEAKDKKIKKLLKKVEASIVQKSSTRAFRHLFSSLKIKFIESVFYDKENGEIGMNKNNMQLLEKVISFNYLMFIKHPRVEADKFEVIDGFEQYIDYILKNTYFTSNYYREQYLLETSKKKKLRVLRNMIGDSTDSYVQHFVEENL